MFIWCLPDLKKTTAIIILLPSLNISVSAESTARVKKVSETDENELTRYHASEMLRLMDEVGKITEFEYMLSVKVLDRLELMPENKLAVVFLSGIRITI